MPGLCRLVSAGRAAQRAFALYGESAWAEPGAVRGRQSAGHQPRRDRSALRSREWRPVPLPAQEGASPSQLRRRCCLRPMPKGGFTLSAARCGAFPPGWRCAIGLTVWFLLAILAILLYAPFWTIGGLIKRRRRPAERAMRLWPLIAALSLAAFVGSSWPQATTQSRGWEI